MKPLSRQRRWQLRQQASGRCTICGRPAGAEFDGLCVEHALKSRRAGRERLDLAGIVQGFSDAPINLKPRRESAESCVAIVMRAGYRSDADWLAAVERARSLLSATREDRVPGLVRFYRSAA